MPPVNRRQVLAAGAAALGLRAGSPEAAVPTRPNLLLLMDDQHRGDCLGADGNRACHTPHLDRLAAEGARFRCAYSAVPSCTPARACLLTGLGPWRNGMLGYGRVAPRYERELPRLLREAGYYTTGIGKMHWSPQRNLHGFHETLLDESGRVESPGFLSDYRQWLRRVAPEVDPDATGLGWNDHRAWPYRLPEELHPTVWTADRAVEFLTDYHRPEPFFLKVSFARPHSPYDPPRRWWDAYAGVDLPAAVVGDWAAGNARPGEPYPDDLARGDLGPDQVRTSRRGYYAAISFIDEQLGRILKALGDRGLLENTLILFVSDHGDMTGDHHLWRKTYAYEPSARVPLLVRWPAGLIDAPRGQVFSQPVELRDILPTFLDAAGIPWRPDWFDGDSLLKLIRGQTTGWRETLDLEHSRCYWPENQWTGLTDGRRKYIYHAPTGQQQLFNLVDDPQECHDLAAEPRHRATVDDWRQRLIAHLSERGAPFVVNGDLALRREATVYSPHYPRAT